MDYYVSVDIIPTNLCNIIPSQVTNQTVFSSLNKYSSQEIWIKVQHFNLFSNTTLRPPTPDSREETSICSVFAFIFILLFLLIDKSVLLGTVQTKHYSPPAAAKSKHQLETIPCIKKEIATRKSIPGSLVLTKTKGKDHNQQ